MTEYHPHQRPPRCQKSVLPYPGYPRSVSTRTTRRTCLKRHCRYFHRISKVSIAAQSILSTGHSLSIVYQRWTERKPGLPFLLTRRVKSLLAPSILDTSQPRLFLLDASMTVSVLMYPRLSQRPQWFLHIQAHILTAQEVIAVNCCQSWKTSDLQLQACPSKSNSLFPHR